MEERHSDMVSEIQRERVLSEVVSVVFCDFDANSARTVRLFRNRRYIHSDLVVRVFCSKRYVFPLLL